MASGDGARDCRRMISEALAVLLWAATATGVTAEMTMTPLLVLTKANEGAALRDN